MIDPNPGNIISCTADGLYAEAGATTTTPVDFTECVSPASDKVQVYNDSTGQVESLPVNKLSHPFVMDLVMTHKVGFFATFTAENTRSLNTIINYTFEYTEITSPGDPDGSNPWVQMQSGTSSKVINYQFPDADATYAVRVTVLDSCFNAGFIFIDPSFTKVIEVNSKNSRTNSKISTVEDAFNHINIDHAGTEDRPWRIEVNGLSVGGATSPVFTDHTHVYLNANAWWHYTGTLRINNTTNSITGHNNISSGMKRIDSTYGLPDFQLINTAVFTISNLY